MLQNAKAAAPVYRKGDRVRRNDWFFSHCFARDAAFYRDRLGTVVGPAEYGKDGMHSHNVRIENWIKVRWDGESGYRVTSVPNLERAEG